MASNQKVSDVMTANPTCAAPDQSVMEVARVMKNEDVGSVPVVSDQNMKLVGIVTDRDLALQIVAEGRDPNTILVSEVMSTNLVTCQPTDDLSKVFKVMEQNQVRRVPVVDQSGNVVGIVAQADIATRVEDPKRVASVVEEISEDK